MVLPVAQISDEADSSAKGRGSREDWLDAAGLALLDGGVDAISISALARSQGLTRGAFYWHFENREALLNALLPKVSDKSEPDALASLKRKGFEDGILALLDTAFAPDTASLDRLAHDQALRRWAETDDHASEITNTNALGRLGCVERFLGRFGYGDSEARIRASMICALFLDGASRASITARMSYPADLKCLFAFITGREIEDSVLSRHLNYTLPRRRSEALRARSAELVVPQAAQRRP